MNANAHIDLQKSDTTRRVKDWILSVVKRGWLPNQLDPGWEKNPVRTPLQALEEDFLNYINYETPIDLRYDFSRRFSEVLFHDVLKISKMNDVKGSVRLSREPKKVHYHPACDHYRRWKEDVIPVRYFPKRPDLNDFLSGTSDHIDTSGIGEFRSKYPISKFGRRL